MNGGNRTTDDVQRHRLLEGVLRRLARSPNSPHFILRGGMLLRMWFRPTPRPASDLDLVCTLPFSIDETARRFAPLLADELEDGVRFYPKAFRAQGIWLDTNFPGVRIFAAGVVDDCEERFSIDFTFGEPLVPPPTLDVYTTWELGDSFPLWMCRPETIIGRKLHALWHMGMLYWRPKDLNDLRLLTRLPLDDASVIAAVETSFASRGDCNEDARGVFKQKRWSMKTSAARWHDFLMQAPDETPPRLEDVVTEAAAKLTPYLERLP